MQSICCAVLRCAVLCRALLCCAMLSELCYAPLYCGLLYCEAESNSRMPTPLHAHDAMRCLHLNQTMLYTQWSADTCCMLSGMPCHWQQENRCTDISDHQSLQEGLTSPMYSMMNWFACRSSHANKPKPLAPARLCRPYIQMRQHAAVLPCHRKVHTAHA